MLPGERARTSLWLLPLSGIALILLLGGTALAGAGPANRDQVGATGAQNLTGATSGHSAPASTLAMAANTPCATGGTPVPTNTPNPGFPSCSVTDASAYLAPEAGSPPNGGTIQVGDRITLDLMIKSGAADITDQQSYLHFDPTRLQNVDAGLGGCVLTSTVTADNSGPFDTALQNEVCNGPDPCVFRTLTYQPGELSFSSGAKANPAYNGPDFRAARIGLCATASGDAVIRWDFSPPAPSNRDSEIVDQSGTLASNNNCYVDYVIHIVCPGAVTPTSTPTPSSSSLLVGHVVWQSRPAQPNRLQQLPVTLTLTSGATRIDYPAQSTDASGFFTVPVGGLPNGTYTWRSKSPQYLSQSGPVTLTGAPRTTADMGLMLAGDANNDNLVNLADFVVLKVTFNSTTDLRADFNGNSIVDAADFTTLKSNFGRGGAIPSAP